LNFEENTMEARNLEWTLVEELAFDETQRAADFERLPAISENGLSSPLELPEPSDMAEYSKRQFTKGEIDRAGELLLPWWEGKKNSPENLGQLYRIVENWRTSHTRPLLTFRMGLEARAKRLEANVIVAQRLKRFSSVMNKLLREPTMKLSQMQDLGGCRAIVSTIEAVDRLYEMYRGNQGFVVLPSKTGHLI
jgi:hypothetical protein